MSLIAELNELADRIAAETAAKKAYAKDLRGDLGNRCEALAREIYDRYSSLWKFIPYKEGVHVRLDNGDYLHINPAFGRGETGMFMFVQSSTRVVQGMYVRANLYQCNNLWANVQTYNVETYKAFLTLDMDTLDKAVAEVAVKNMNAAARDADAEIAAV